MKIENSRLSGVKKNPSPVKGYPHHRDKLTHNVIYLYRFDNEFVTGKRSRLILATGRWFCISDMLAKLRHPTLLRFFLYPHGAL